MSLLDWLDVLCSSEHWATLGNENRENERTTQMRGIYLYLYRTFEVLNIDKAHYINTLKGSSLLHKNEEESSRS